MQSRQYFKHLFAAIDQGITDASLGDRMPGIVYYHEFTLWPMLVEQNSLVNRADHIIATMHDKSWYIFHFMDVIEYLARG